MKYGDFSHPIKAEVALLIGRELDRRKMSIRTLAKELGTYHVVIHRVLTGENWTIDLLIRIFEHLELELVAKHKNE